MPRVSSSKRYKGLHKEINQHSILCLKNLVKNIFNHSYVKDPGVQLGGLRRCVAAGGAGAGAQGARIPHRCGGETLLRKGLRTFQLFFL